MSHGYPQQRPGYPQYGHQPQNSGGGVMKTCLIVGAVIGGISLVVVLGCGIGAFFLGRSAMDSVETASNEARARVEEISAPVIPPTTIDQAIVYLNKDDEESHRVAAEFLAKQPFDRDYQSRVNKGLMIALDSSDRRGQRAAVQALKTWGDGSSASEVAASLRSGDELNRDKLELLGRWARPIGTSDIAKLLESPSDAENAYQALKRIGTSASPAVAEYLGKSGRAGEYSKQLLEEWGIDPDEALVKLHIQRLSSDNTFERSEAAKQLAIRDFDPQVQADVVKAVKNAYAADLGDKGELLNVLVKWGDASCLDVVHQSIREDRFDRSEAIQVAINIKDPSSIPILAELLDEFGGDGNEAVNALVAFGDDAIEPTLLYFNHESDHARERARRVMTTLDVPTEKLLDQTIEDMRSEEEGRATAACEWISTINVVSDRRSEVAAAMAGAMDKVNVFKKREIADTFCDWATQDESDLLLDLVEDGDENVWLPAFKKLLTFDNPDAIKLATAELLTSFFKREEALKAMQQADPPCEDLAIIMLGHNDEDVCFEMCRLLSVVGTEKALRPLEDLADRAVKAREAEVAQAARLARTEIRSRAAAIRNASGGDGDDSNSDDGNSDDGDSGGDDSDDGE